MADEQVIYSDPAVTTRAKDFLHDSSLSEEYKKAADKAILEVVSAIRQRIDQSLVENKTYAPTKKRAKRNLFLREWLKRK